jgi:transcription-repair coupling factor (superfamily II helicase)
MDIDPRDLAERLVDNGFARTDLVGEPGDFAFRGGIVDVFPSNLDQPVRIELIGDTIESIRLFETDTQRSADRVARVTIDPLEQFALTKATRSALAGRMSVDFNDPIYKYDLNEKIERLLEGGRFPGVEAAVHLAAGAATFPGFLDECGGDWLTCVVEPDEITSSLQKYGEMLRAEFETAVARGKAVYPPDRLLSPLDGIQALLDVAPVAVSEIHLAGSDREEVRIRAGAAPRFVNRLADLPDGLRAERERGHSLALFIATRGGREKTERVLRELEIPYDDDPASPGGALAVTGGSLPDGFVFEPARLAVFSEWDLYEAPIGSKVAAARRRTTDAFMSDLRDLKPATPSCTSTTESASSAVSGACRSASSSARSWRSSTPRAGSSCFRWRTST